MFRVAIIPTFNRPDVCREAVESVYKQVDIVYVIDVGDVKPMPRDTENAWQHYYVRNYIHESPNNLSKTWNYGLDLADCDADKDKEWEIVVLNDDVIVPEGWVEAVSGTMREHKAAAACAGNHDVILRQPGPVPLDMRMTGWAFMLAGEKKLRADKRFQWWFGDSDLDWQARQAGGMAMMRFPQVQNRFANQSTVGVRAEQSQEDGRRFFDKWQLKPW